MLTTSVIWMIYSTLLLQRYVAVHGCPSTTSCTCTTVRARTEERPVIGRKVVCAGKPGSVITNIAAIKPELLPADTLQL